MKKYRIRHLLEEKAVREDREITLADLSEKTGVSYKELKIISDTSCDPGRDVLDKVAGYFGCSVEDLIDGTKEIIFDLAAAFPKDDEFAADLIALLTAVNDITFLQGLDLHYRTVQGIKEKINGERLFVFYLAIGSLREGMIVFRRLLVSKHAKTLCKKLKGEHKLALENLKKDSDGVDSLYNTDLRGLRNDAAFHYLQKPYFDALTNIRQKEGHFLAGLTYAESRFLVADDVRSEIFRSYIDFDGKQAEVEPKLKRLHTAMGEFMKFATGFLIAYLEDRNVKYKIKD